MTHTDRCPDCGGALPPGRPGGFCPACLLRMCDVEPAAPDSIPGDTGTDALGGECPGMRIGRYRLLEPIGEGGFGTVWMAEQTEPVRRKVALKITKLGMDTRHVVARFEAERQALALMDHPNIARVFDGGATASGRPYFVMELVRGVPVTTYCDRAKLTTRERLQLLIGVCQAVQHAHQKGVIHRDLKPSNILVTELNGTPVPKVIDFGIAKATGTELTDKTLFTHFNQLMGTPAYMSPEQAGLGSLDVDTRTDIYSLGVILYELLTGRTPLDPHQLNRVGPEAMLKAVREIEAARPSTHLSTLALADLESIASRRREPPQHLLQLLRGDLDWIVLKALEKDRARRYESANGLAADLQRFLNDEPVGAVPPTMAYQFAKFARKHRVAIATAAAFVTVLLAGTTVSIWQAVRATRMAGSEREANSRAQAASREARDAKATAEAVAQRLRAHAYGSDMNAAFAALQANRVGRARELMEQHRPRNGETNDLPGFEWRYLWSVTGPKEITRFTNAAGWGLALSRDGRSFAGVGDGHLRIWSVPEGRPLATLMTNASWMFSGAFSPDGRWLAIPQKPPGAHGVVQLWNVQARSKVDELRAAEPSSNDSPLGVCFNSDGRLLAAVGGEWYNASSPSQVRVWDTETRALQFVLPIPAWAYQVAFSRDNRVLAIACGDGVVRIWDLATRSLVAQLPGHHGFVLALAFFDNGTRLASGDESGNIWIWDWAAQVAQFRFSAHQGPLYSLAFSSDEQRLASASRDFSMKLWDRNNWRMLSCYLGHAGGVNTVRFLPGDETLITSGHDSTVRIWAATPDSAPRLQPQTRPTSTPGVRFCSGGRFLARVEQGANRITFFDAITRAEVKVVTGSQLGALFDGKHVAVLGDSDLVILDPLTLGETRRIRCAPVLGGRPAFSPDGKSLVVLGADVAGESPATRAIVVDTDRLKVVKEIETGTRGWTPVFLARNGSLLLIPQPRDQRVTVWDARHGRQVTQLDVAPADFDAMAISPDGGMFAISGSDGRVQLWDMNQLSQMAPIVVGTGKFPSLEFSPDSKTLAVGTMPGEIELWSLATRQFNAVLPGHHSYVAQIAFSPDGMALASAGFDLTVCLWRAPSFDQIARWESESGAGVPPRIDSRPK